MSPSGLICSHCNDVSDVVTPFNGSTLLANTSSGEMIVALHTRCEGAWADKHNCRTLVPLKRTHRWNTRTSSLALQKALQGSLSRKNHLSMRTSRSGGVASTV
jgi:hypothetical protein